MSQSARRFKISSDVPLGSFNGYELRAAAKLIGITSGDVVEEIGRAVFPEPYVAKNRVSKFFRGAPDAPDLQKEVHSFLLARADLLLNKLALVLKFDIRPADEAIGTPQTANAALREALALRIAADQALLKALTEGGL